MTTTINTTTVFKNWKRAHKGGAFMQLGVVQKTDGTMCNCWYDVANDVLYCDPTFNDPAAQNPSVSS